MTFFDRLPSDLINKVNTYKEPKYSEKYVLHKEKDEEDEYIATFCITFEDHEVCIPYTRYNLSNTHSQKLARFLIDYRNKKQTDLTMVKNDDKVILEYSPYNDSLYLSAESKLSWAKMAILRQPIISKVIKWLEKIESGKITFGE